MPAMFAAHPKTNLPRAHSGLTLIEVMVAVVIALILLAVTVSIFVGNKRAYSEQEEMGRLQENARFALEMMMYDIRMAGYFGCSDESDTVLNHVKKNGVSDLYDSTIAVEGSEAGADWKPSGTDMDAAYTADSGDGISIRYLQPGGYQVEGHNNASAEIDLNKVDGMAEGQIVAISDCANTDIFQITQVQAAGAQKIQHNTGGGSSPGNLKNGDDDFDPANCPSMSASNCFSKEYGTDAQIVFFISRRYFICDADGDGVPSLCRNHVRPDGAGNAEIATEELVEGIENMQILYGVDGNDDRIADLYCVADDVDTTDCLDPAATWDNVVSVQLALLARTVDEYGTDTDAATYNLLGDVIDPVDDRRRRRVFTGTIQIRNRSF